MSRKWLTPLAAFALVVSAAPAAADEHVELDEARIGKALTAMIEERRTVGASVLVWKDGREALYSSAGLADREARRPFARDTLVQIFSMTKPVTGVALMQLWEQGKFGLDDPLARHLPQFADVQVYDAAEADTLRPPARAITVRDVLRHTAGFTYGGADHPTDAAWDRLMPQVPLLYDPGTHWHYSAGVDVQARLVEVLSGQPFDAYVRDHVFRPLGMTSSCWKCSRGLLPRLARIYEAGEDGAMTPMAETTWLEPNFAGKPMTMGGSGIVTTIDDYMKFARMLLGEGELDGARILRPATVRLMATDQLDPRIAEADRLWLPGKGNGGFGFDFFVRTGRPLTPEENRGAIGEFYWDGYPSMLFWVDPLNDMAVVFAAQKVPIDIELHRDIRAAIYGADYDGR